MKKSDENPGEFINRKNAEHDAAQAQGEPEALGGFVKSDDQADADKLNAALAEWVKQYTEDNGREPTPEERQRFTFTNMGLSPEAIEKAMGK